MGKECAFCKKLYESNDRRVKYCSNECAKAARRELKRIRKSKGKPKRLICHGFKANEQGVAQRIECKTSRFVYIGGWTTINGYMYLECKDCGLIFKHSAHFARPSNHKVVRCPNCDKKKEYVPVSKIKSKCLYCGVEIVGNRKKKYCSGNCAGSKWKIDNNYKPIRKNKIKPKQLQFKQCECCHNLFLPENSHLIYCSRECRRKIENRKREIKRRMHGDPREVGKIDLKVLFDRDHGICHICKCVCDWDDHEWLNGNFIIGSKYPTRDHLIPLSKGGEDKWENVKLACWKCNTERGAKDLDEIRKFKRAKEAQGNNKEYSA